MSDRDIESKIQAAGKTAPRVTPTDIEANIASEVYFVAADALRFGWLTSDPRDSEERQRKNSVIESLPGRSHGGACMDIDANVDIPAPLGLLTFCVLVLRNGFTVTGESACASPENFDPQIGRDIARQNAIAKIWPLMGYELRTKLAAEATGLPPIEGVLGDVRIVSAADSSPTESPVAGPAEILIVVDSLRVETPVPPTWKPRIGNQVMVKGYIANGTDEHPGLVTRVHGAGQGAFANVTAFPDLQSPKIFSSIPVYSNRAAAEADIPGATRRRDGFAYLLNQE